MVAGFPVADEDIDDYWHKDEINGKLGNRELRCRIEVRHGAQNDGWCGRVPGGLGLGTWNIGNLAELVRTGRTGLKFLSTYSMQDRRDGRFCIQSRGTFEVVSGNINMSGG